MTGRREGPPPGSRKVPGLKLWMTEQGEPYGPKGPLAVTTLKEHAHMSVTRDSGSHTSTTVAKAMAETWLQPKPPESRIVHLDGDKTNNAAANLAWKAFDTQADMRRRWERKTLKEMEDPGHPKHGTVTGYKAGCRCERCTRASRIANAAYDVNKTLKQMGIDPRATPRP